MSNTEHTIFISNRSYNFSAWFDEKISYIIRSLCRIADCIDEYAPDGENVDRQLYNTVYYTIVILIVLNECEDNYNNEASIVCEHGYEGYKTITNFLCKHYDTAEKTMYISGNSDNQYASFYKVTDNLLEELSLIIDSLKESDYYDVNFRKHFITALSYAIKLFSIISESKINFNNEDIDLIINNKSNHDSYEIFMRMCNIPTRKSIEETEDNIARKTFVELINSNDFNRTLLHIELDRIKNKTEYENKISDDLEQVTMGEKTVDWFKNKHTQYKA